MAELKPVKTAPAAAQATVDKVSPAHRAPVTRQAPVLHSIHPAKPANTSRTSWHSWPEAGDRLLTFSPAEAHFETQRHEPNILFPLAAALLDDSVRFNRRLRRFQ
jgi:hypothetical protein